MFTELDSISPFCLFMYMCFLFILLPHFVLIMSFDIRNKAALRTLMQIYLAIYMALHIFFPRSLRSLGIKTLIKCILQTGTSTNPYIS